MTTAWRDSPEAQRELGRRSFGATWPRIAHAARVITGYWRSDQWPVAWALLIVSVSYSFIAIAVSVRMNTWERDFFDAVAAHNAAAIPRLLGTLLVIILVSIVSPLIGTYLNALLTLRWKIWLTQRYMRRWMERRKYYDIERARILDNPDQRMTEDVSLLTSQVINLLIGAVTSVLRAITFSYIVFATVHGGMVLFAWGYALVSTWAVGWVARPLVQRTMRQQHAEADLRFNLVNIRRNSEQIAFSDAAPLELGNLGLALHRVWRATLRSIHAQVLLMAVSSLFGHLSSLAPLILILPQYLAGHLTLGKYMQIAGPGGGAFQQLQSSLAFFVQAFQSMATQVAVINRLKALDDAIDQPRTSAIAIQTDESAQIAVSGLTLSLPDGTALLQVDGWSICRGQRWTLRGPSGSGKSTLLRAIAGLWPEGAGRITLPSSGLIMFVSQRLYLPIGPLKASIAFPAHADVLETDRVKHYLRRCNLAALVDRLDEEQSWQEVLSPGEQQRLAFVRILVHRPDYLILDEPTSALDPDNACSLYETLLTELPAVALLSVTHTDLLDRFHDRTATVVGGTLRLTVL